jgi:hypothetical protein
MEKNEHNIARCSLTLNEAQWGQLLDRIESGKGPTVPATRDRRDLDATRYPLVRPAAMRVVHPGGNVTSHLVRTRNLSAGGVGILHSSFLHPGTACHFAIKTIHGENVAVPARILWCRHVEGRCHELGLRFDRMLQIDEFVPAKAAKSGTSAA